MRHLNGDEMMSGFGGVAEVHEGLDGNLYEWVEGLSAWGDPVGYWQGLSEVPVEGRAVAGLGALYQASDGSLYTMRGLGEEEEKAKGGGEDEKDDDAAPKMGPGKPGEMKVGPDGKRYRWVLGVGPGGKRTGFWRRLSPRPAGAGGAPAPQARPGAPAGPPRPGARPPAAGGRKKKPFLKRLLPFAKVAASLIPIPGAGAAVKAGLNIADKLLTKKGVAGYDGLGALYQAADGTVYQLRDVAEDELRGLYETDGYDGFAAEDDLRGLALEDDVDGVDDDGDIRGWADAPEPGIGAEPIEGYVRDDPRGGLRGYVREKPPQTRMFEPTRELPALWKPLW